MNCIARTKINFNRCSRKATSGIGGLFCDEHTKQPIFWTFALVFTVLVGTLTIWQSIKSYLKSDETQLEQPSVNTLVPSEREATNAGRGVLATLREFPVEGNYVPSGKMGDTSGVTINEIRDGARRFTYVTQGKGPHQWEYRYDNDEPAQFAGVMYLNPANAWGTLPDCGYDLRGFRSVAGEARSLSGPANVNFVVGGIEWFWDEKKREKVKPPYGDSMRKSVPHSLSEEWKPFSILLDAPEDHLKRVVGGFGWTISWGENQIQLNRDRTTAETPKTFMIELRNVRFLKDPLPEK